MTADIILAAVAGVSTLLGGALFLKTRLQDVGAHYLVAFAAGVLLSTAFFGMIPEAQGNILVVGIGFLSFYLMEKLLLLHACPEGKCDYQYHEVGWLSVAGMSIDNFVDGAAIASGFLIDPALGMVIAVAVFAHELAHGVSTAIIMKPKYAVRTTLLALLIASILTPIGAYLSRFFPEAIFDNVLAFAAGTFLYIGASDLLPEAHEEFNWKVILVVLIGVLLIVGVRMLILPA